MTEAANNAPPGLALSADRLGKKYTLYSSGAGRLLEGLTGGLVNKHRDFWALRDFSFAVEKGEAVGIIGQNGSGKSTLLKLLAGLTRPSEGSVRVEGRVGSLIELGTGFNPEFSGRVNARLNAALLGVSPEQFDAKFPEIEKFAAIGDFLDRPIKTYSTGMQVRLAFSVAIAVEPEVLLIDEALAVGDLLFQQKCFQRLKLLRERGVTLVMVTHDLSAVKNFCDRAYLLDKGQCLAAGPTAAVVDDYNALIQKRALAGTEREIVSTTTALQPAPRHGSFEAVITGIELLDAHGQRAEALTAGADGVIRVQVAFLDEITDPVVGILIRDRLTNAVFGTNTHLHHLHPGRLLPGESLEARFTMPFDLGPAEYSITAAVHTGGATFEDCFDWADNLLAFRILPTEPGFIGTARLRPVITLAPHGPAAGGGEAAFAALFSDAPAALDLANDAHRKFLIRGFYPAERDDQGVFRWSQEESTFVLAPAQRRVELFAQCLPPEGGVLTLALRAGARELSPLEITSPGWQPLVFALPDDFPPGPQRFRLRVSPAYVPAEHGGGADIRRLGIALRKIGSAAADQQPAGG
jgi:lipopolysaccharide transport system ATP-binding protein